MATGVFEFQPIIPKRVLSSRKVRGTILAAMQRLERIYMADFEATVDSWDTPVDFESNIRFAGGDATLEVFTDNPIYSYLNDGTSIRWAVMNNPFEPKTSKGVIGSGPGARTYNKAGEYTAIRGRQAMLKRGIPPRPGIEAREFTIAISNKNFATFVNTINDAVRRGLL